MRLLLRHRKVMCASVVTSQKGYVCACCYVTERLCVRLLLRPGPVLPIISVDSAEDAIARINEICDHPLALYVFAQDMAVVDQVRVPPVE